MCCRWGKNGPVACTLDTSRLFASYRNGSIAVVLDASGNGSVMTPSGRCVLNLRGGGAEAMDDKGAVVSVYDKEEQAGRGGETVEWEFENVKVQFSPSNWEVCTIATHQVHSPLIILYGVINSSLLQLCVLINNGRVECAFSSVSGGKILRGNFIDFVIQMIRPY